MVLEIRNSNYVIHNVYKLHHEQELLFLKIIILTTFETYECIETDNV